MPSSRALLSLLVLSLAAPVFAAAQTSPAELDSTRARIHTTLRAFYFNLAHQDWEALTADVLPAKVVAHRPAPEALVAAAAMPERDPAPSACSTTGAAVEQAAITLEGDWAEVSVPRCAPAPAGSDEFRLIRFEQRWRFVYIDLYQPG
jgi:hypothetical protein